MEEKKKCNSCKKQGLSKKEIGMVSLGFAILGFAVYGIIHFIRHNF